MEANKECVVAPRHTWRLDEEYWMRLFFFDGQVPLCLRVFLARLDNSVRI